MARSNPRAMMGLMIVIISIITLISTPWEFSGYSGLIAFFGLIVMISPDLNSIQSRTPSQPSSESTSFSESSNISKSSSVSKSSSFTPKSARKIENMRDKCSDCGKPVPSGVAYCRSCSSKKK